MKKFFVKEVVLTFPVDAMICPDAFYWHLASFLICEGKKPS
jgi:hypothetical protein